MPFRIFESFRAVFYTPFYLPHALGAYEAEGLDVELGTSPSLDFVAAHLQQGEADAYWGGPMRIMVNHDRDPECGMVGFRSTIESQPDTLERITRAMYRSQKWLHEQPSSDVAAAVTPFFPDLACELLVRAIDRYRALGVWGRNPRLPRQGFERLRAALLSGGLIGKAIPFEDCVDNRFADAVIAADPAAL